MLIICALRALLDWLYTIYVHPVWPNKGFVLEINNIKYIESWLLFLCAAFFIPHTLKRPSDFFILILGILLILPVTSLYGLAGEPRWITYSVLAGCFLIVLVRRGGLYNLPVWSAGPQFALAISISMLVIVIAWMFFSGGYSYINFDLKEVYEYRDDINRTVNQGIFSYLNSWVFKVCNLFLFAYALVKRRWGLSIFFFCFQILLFGLMAQKSILVFPFMVLILWYYFRENRSLVIVPISLIAVILFAVIIWVLSADIYSFPISVVVRRLFYVTANNVYDYFIYFSKNPHIYWSNSIASSWMEYPYEVNYPNLIGDYQAMVLGKTILAESISHGVYVNSSFIATGYMHAGFFGLLFYCLLVGILFRVIDNLVSVSMPLWFATSITFVPVSSLLISSDFPTALLTHGILLSILLLFFARGMTASEIEADSINANQ